MMKRIGETLVTSGLVLSLALGVTACGGNNRSDAPDTRCIGVDFATPKGGPGNILMNVFPVFNRNFGDARQMEVSGIVKEGDSAGTEIIDSPGLQAGSFNFKWNSSDLSDQTSLVEAKVNFEGTTYTCSPTKLHFDPHTYKVTPHLANSPY